MIYLFSGDDAKKKLAHYEAFLRTLPQGVDMFSMVRNNFDPGKVESFYSGASLFSAVSVVVFDGILERVETRDFILGRLKSMDESENIFVFLEGKLLKPVIDAFKKARAEIHMFDLPKGKKERLDTFRIANAFAAKDKLNTWIYFREAIENGASLEELVGILFWKIKDMILRKNFSKFSEVELVSLAARISYLLPEARKQGRDAEAAFEQFLLEAF